MFCDVNYLFPPDLKRIGDAEVNLNCLILQCARLRLMPTSSRDISQVTPWMLVGRVFGVAMAMV